MDRRSYAFVVCVSSLELDLSLGRGGTGNRVRRVRATPDRPAQTQSRSRHTGLRGAGVGLASPSGWGHRWSRWTWIRVAGVVIAIRRRERLWMCGGAHTRRARSRFTSKVILLRFTYQLSHSLRVSTSTTMLMLCTCKVACTLSERLLPKFERIEARAASSPADEVRPMPRAAWGLPLGSIGDISAGQFQTMLREPLSDHRAWHARRQPQPRLWLQPHQH